MNETTLVAQLKAKNEMAFQTLVNTYQNMIGNVCYGFVQNQVEAEELVQDVFVEVYTSIEKFQQKSKLSTWLYRIAVNKSLNHVAKRKQKRRLKTVSTFFGFGEDKEREYKDNRSKGVEETIQQQELRDALHKALEKLPQTQRTAFVLRKYEECSYVEIAEVMETSISSVESLIHRASRNMKKHLTGFYEYYNS